MKQILRRLVPQKFLNIYRNRKKNVRRKELELQRNNGDVISVERLLGDFQAAGIRPGDSVLVHCSMSKIGYIEEGAKTIVDSLSKVVGENGNILMPTSPNAGLQLEFVRKNPVFDVLNSPSKTGALSEFFRKLPGVVRSEHPTESVAALGPKASWFTGDHFGQLTPYNDKSPFYRLSEAGGKILYIGVTFDNAGTNLHTLEDAVDFKFPVYYPEVFETTVIDTTGNRKTMKTKVHNPEYSTKRKCDELIPLFESTGVLTHGNIGKAACLIVDAKKLLEVMIEAYRSKGITMYTPKGS